MLRKWFARCCARWNWSRRESELDEELPFHLRLALGADPRHLRRLVLWQASRPLLTGLAIGLAGAFVLTQKLQASLYEITPHDPPTLAAALLLLVTVGLVAAYVPARRASRVDPLIALRSE